MDIDSLLLLFIVTVLALGAAMLVMAVGVIFKRKCLRGSCGGVAVRDANGEAITCDDCPNRGTPGKSPIVHARRLTQPKMRGVAQHPAAPDGNA